MKIALTEIRGMDRRVRQQMSPEKLEELTESLKEVGQVCPVKVRKNGHGYTLVYGHRRVMAAKAAGLKEVEAIVADVADDKLLTQALIENVIRENMAAIDIAKALRAILDETGCTQAALAKRLGWGEGPVSDYLSMLDAPIKKATEVLARELGVDHVRQARAATAGDAALAARVLKKAAEEELSTRQTRKVAEVVKRAHDYGGDKAVQRVLSQRADAILRTADSLPAHKPKPKAAAREVTGRALFQWIKDPRVVLAEEGLKSVSALVSIIARSQDDRAGGKIVLKSLRKLTANILRQLDNVIDRL
jgi:ParB family chromosome partitioning protein